MEKKGVSDKLQEMLGRRPKANVYAGVYLAVADSIHVVVLAGPPALLEILEDESDRLANLGWWGARGLPAEPGVWRCQLEERPFSYNTVDGTEHDVDWRVTNAERVWAPPAASVMDS